MDQHSLPQVIRDRCSDGQAELELEQDRVRDRLRPGVVVEASADAAGLPSDPGDPEALHAQAGVQNVAQSIAEQVKSERHDEDEKPRQCGDVRREGEEVPPFGEH